MEKAPTRKIRIETLSPESFEPFGWIFQLRNEKIKLPPINLDLSGGEPNLIFSFQPFRDFLVDKMERHLGITQAFFSLDGRPSIIVVSPPTDSNMPRSEEIKAFMTEGTECVVLAKGTWHDVGRFPLYRPGVNLAILTSKETREDLEEKRFKLTEIISLKEKMKAVFKLEL